MIDHESSCSRRRTVTIRKEKKLQVATQVAKSLGMMGLKSKKICVCNMNGYFDGFLQMMRRASDDNLLYGNVNLFFDVVSTPEEAVEWCKRQFSNSPSESTEIDSSINSRVVAREKETSSPPAKTNSTNSSFSLQQHSLPFLAGLALGVAVAFGILRSK